ncbi:bifunctional diguanylate cyclase/phosphodiesterase [Alicyclobacillus suci]|uniref:bifunctional diguanylate cyclase/phosphodiesterase n=1 Tax=Alicyclobacillus suci TaxID=2816080 RepID=UPI001A90411A|nr:bifunctional diguanylate cyclase/phosphodiesterase [Alicyclobacillus suci]
MVVRTRFKHFPFRAKGAVSLFFDDALLDLITRQPVGMIFLDIDTKTEAKAGLWGGHIDLQRALGGVRLVAGCSILAVQTVSTHVFIAVQFIVPDGNLSTRLYEAAIHLHQDLVASLTQASSDTSENVRFHFGTAVIRPDGTMNPTDLVYEGMVRALMAAKSDDNTNHRTRQAALVDIISRGRIKPVYQPIVSLWTGEAFGYEALSRTPEHSEFASPNQLFDFAEREGQLEALEEVALRSAILHYQPLHQSQKLFLNIHASMFFGNHAGIEQVLSVLERRALKPYDIVLELTERRGIDDFNAFRKAIQRYRQKGYLIAIDDAGAGYSSLQTIAEVQPDFIKIDRSLVAGVHMDKTKEALLKALCHAALACDSRVIAEGIETYEELVSVTEMGVPYGQGYCLGRPAAEPVAISEQARTHIRRAMTSDKAHVHVTTTIGDIAQPTKTFGPTVKASEIVNFFNQNDQVTGVVVVDDQSHPLGLVMREKLFRKLATKYGVSLFWNREIDQVMDHQPLILDESVSVENASVLSMARNADTLYDLIIVTRDGKLMGASSIQLILSSITNAQLELARDANPLTGLPGNRRIDVELSRRISSDDGFCIFYIDLDHFKWFNDAFGFQKGDQMIRCLADVLKDVVHNAPVHEAFVGHIGGDDFIVVTEPGYHQELATAIQAQFTQEVHRLLPNSRERLWHIRSRSGEMIESEGLTLSISILVCEPPHITQSLETLSAYAGALKQMAKDGVGNKIVCESIQNFSQNELRRDP